MDVHRHFLLTSVSGVCARVGAASVRWALGAALLATPACRPTPDGGPCASSAPNVPAFELLITASGEPFHQLKFDLRSGGGHESYDLVSMCDPASSLACFRAAPGDLCETRSDASHPALSSLALKSLTCALWSDGAIELSVYADGYAPFVALLTPARDDCERITTQGTAVTFGERD